MSDLQLTKGDSENVAVRLTDGENARDLSGCSVILIMNHEYGKMNYSIQCKLGATINGEVIPASMGGITIPFTQKETALEGLFYSYLKVVRLGKTVTYPSTGAMMIKIR